MMFENSELTAVVLAQSTKLMRGYLVCLERVRCGIKLSHVPNASQLRAADLAAYVLSFDVISANYAFASSEKFAQPRLVGSEIGPGGFEPLQAFRSILAAAFGLDLTHRYDGIDAQIQAAVAPMRTAAEAIAEWCDAHPSSYPPTILHVTDGASTDGAPRRGRCVEANVHHRWSVPSVQPTHLNVRRAASGVSVFGQWS